MSDEGSDVGTFFGGLFLIGLIRTFVFAVVGCNRSREQYQELQKEAIKQVAAEYNSITGVWQWKQPAQPLEKGDK